MDYKIVRSVLFSPTGTTKTIVENIVIGMGIKETAMLDLTVPEIRLAESPIFENELVIIAVPVYYGRIPEVVVPFLNALKGKNSAVIAVVVYGNRAYDDALKELYDIVSSGGFVPVAAGAFIGEHSYSISGREIAHGRPDKNDKQKARDFGSMVADKLAGMNSLGSVDNFTVPGNEQYIEPSNLIMLKKIRKEMPVSLTPETDMNRCTKCNNCIEVCPDRAIDMDDVSKVDKYKCMICFACVKICPTQAKQMKEQDFNKAIENLKEACIERKEPELFI